MKVTNPFLPKFPGNLVGCPRDPDVLNKTLTHLDGTKALGCTRP